MGHNKQSGGFREAQVEPLEGYETIPTVDELRKKSDDSGPGVSAKGNAAFDPVTGQPLSEALRARPDPAAGKKLQEARAAEAIEQEKRMAAGATTRPREGLEFLKNSGFTGNIIAEITTRSATDRDERISDVRASLDFVRQVFPHQVFSSGEE